MNNLREVGVVTQKFFAALRRRQWLNPLSKFLNPPLPRSPTRLVIWLQDGDRGLPNEYSLGHCCLSAASKQALLTTHNYM